MNTSNKALKIILIVVFALAIIANGVQGYFFLKKVKAYHNLEAIINNKSNCDKCPAQVESPTESTPTPTPTSKSGSSGSGATQDTVAPPESVVAPPPPPAD